MIKRAFVRSGCPAPAAMVCCALSLLFPASIAGQTTESARVEVTLAEALSLFQESNLALKASRADAVVSVGLARQAGAFPNPEVGFTHEPLSDGETDYSETYLTLSQRLRWPGLTRAKIRQAEAEMLAARAESAGDSLRLALELVRTYIEAASNQDRLEVLRDVADTIRRGQSSWEAQHAEGEVSGYDVRRIRVERTRYENRLAEAELELRASGRRLALMIFLEGIVIEAMPVDEPAGAPAEVSLDGLLDLARENRPEIAAARAAFDASRFAIDVSRGERMPEPVLMAGLKQQSDGLDGFIVGASLSIPIFNRNSGQIQASAARMRASELREQLLIRQIEEQVRDAYETYVSLRHRFELVDQDLLAGTEDLLEIAVASYGEGELTVLELLDAAAAYRDARLARIELLEAVWISYSELMRTAAMPLPSSLN